MKLAAFVRLSRLHFLAGGFLMFALGALAARPVNWTAYVIGQLMVTAAQITAHYVNEYADYDADMLIANRTNFSGGSGVLTSGALSRRVALYAAFVSTSIAIVAAGFVAHWSVAAALLGLASLAVSWAYSMPPVRLLNTGTGELFTALTVAFFVPFIGALVSAHSIDSGLWWATSALVLVQLTMLLGFELPDVGTDADAGKRVLAVRIGVNETRIVIGACLLAAYAVTIAAVIVSALSPIALEFLLIAGPLVIVSLLAGSAQKHGLTTFTAVASFALSGVIFCLALA